jgi:glycogen operon protein
VEASVDLSYHSQTIAYYLNGKSQGDVDLYVMINAYTEPLRFTIFDGLHKPWFRVVDTSRSSPDDMRVPGDEVQIIGSTFIVQPRSVVVLMQ